MKVTKQGVRDLGHPRPKRLKEIPPEEAFSTPWDRTKKTTEEDKFLPRDEKEIRRQRLARRPLQED